MTRFFVRLCRSEAAPRRPHTRAMVLRDTIQTNERELRRWDHAVVNEMVDAVVFSLPALEPWVPWALTSLGTNEMRTAFSKGPNYGLFWRNFGQLVESVGLH